MTRQAACAVSPRRVHPCDSRVRQEELRGHPCFVRHVRGRDDTDFACHVRLQPFWYHRRKPRDVGRHLDDDHN